MRISYLLPAAVSVLLVACEPPQATSPTAEPAVALHTGAAPPATELPAEDGSLVLYSGRSEALVGPLLAQFTEATGISVEARWGNTAELAATLLEEGTRSPSDVYLAQDPGGLGAVEALLAPLPESALQRVAPEWRDPDGRWVGLSGRARVVVYNTAVLTETDLPRALEGFTAPEWSGRIGWAPSNASFQTMVTAMRKVWGEDKTREWLAGILANQPVAFDGNSAIVQAAGSGEIDVGFVNHYYLYRFIAEEGPGFGARNFYLADGGPGSLVMPAGVGILASSARPLMAAQLVEFLVSAEAQTYFAQETYEYPLVAGVPVAAELPPLADLSAPDIDVTDLADMQSTVELLRAVGALP